MGKTKIEYVTDVWNPLTGCDPVSEGCENCYARRMAYRLKVRCGYPADNPFRVTLHPQRLDQPLRQRKPRRIFVCSMGDLFHEDVPEKFLYDVWDVMVLNRQHTFLVLTKRPARMKNFIERVMANRMDYAYTLGNTPEGTETRKWAQKPVQNIWLGVTAENQQTADKRIPILLQIPAAVRFVSVEPMLGPVDLERWLPIEWSEVGETWIEAFPGKHCYDTRLHWVICGGETGPGARPMHPDWARSLRDQCQATGVPFFLKSWGEHCYPSQMPDTTYYALLDRYDLDQDAGAHHVIESPWKVGKKAAGRLLDGRTWDEVPDNAS